MSDSVVQSIFDSEEREQAESAVRAILDGNIIDGAIQVAGLVPRLVDAVERVVAESDSDNLREVTAVNRITVSVRKE